MKSIVAAIAALAIAVVSAQTGAPITPHAPTKDQVLTAGTTTVITWTTNPGHDTISSIDLVHGDPNALVPVVNGHVADNVPTAPGTYNWNIPADLPAGTDYALSFGKSPDVTYTPFFTIKAAGASAGNSTGAASSAPAASASGKPSSVASSSAPASSAPAAASSAPAASKPAAASPAAGSSAPAGSSAAASSTPAKTPSSANKNVAAMGAIAAAGAVAAALF
ncbi:hypothetical protein RMATCC62417_00201 [Rhizopus microsporus]|nr:hypothetical protein RMATCC62417_00201 [Rhizopus microsporus]